MSTSVFTRLHLRDRIRDRDTAVYSILLILALVFPMASIYATDGTALVSQATRAGTFVLLAIGLNVVSASPACSTSATPPSTRSARIRTRCLPRHSSRRRLLIMRFTCRSG